jgi:transcriptional regulator with XRE-family HTH domain
MHNAPSSAVFPSAPEGPDPVDAHIGQRIKSRRVMLGLSQEKLGEILGLTFQQIQKYERGTNRVSASRLHHISQALDTNTGFFYEDLPKDVYQLADQQLPAMLHDSGAAALPYESDPLKRNETMRLVCAYYRHQDAEVRRHFVELLESTARTPGSRKHYGGS